MRRTVDSLSSHSSRPNVNIITLLSRRVRVIFAKITSHIRSRLACMMGAYTGLLMEQTTLNAHNLYYSCKVFRQRASILHSGLIANVVHGVKNWNHVMHTRHLLTTFLDSTRPRRHTKFSSRQHHHFSAAAAAGWGCSRSYETREEASVQVHHAPESYS